MCGIAGLILREASVQEAVLRPMVDALAHRGPDGHGIFVEDSFGLIHTRFSIIDLRGGQQPIRNREHRLAPSPTGKSIITWSFAPNWRQKVIPLPPIRIAKPFSMPMSVIRFTSSSDCMACLPLPYTMGHVGEYCWRGIGWGSTAFLRSLSRPVDIRIRDQGHPPALAQGSRDRSGGIFAIPPQSLLHGRRNDFRRSPPRRTQ